MGIRIFDFWHKPNFQFLLHLKFALLLQAAAHRPIMAITCPRRRGILLLVAAFVAAAWWQQPASVSACQKEPVKIPGGECTENEIIQKSELVNKKTNETYGEKEKCNNCYCIKGKWKCEIKRCSCYPGAPIHIWMNNVRYGCFCTLEGILNKSDCTPEWFSIRKGRSVPSRLQYHLRDPE